MPTAGRGGQDVPSMLNGEALIPLADGRAFELDISDKSNKGSLVEDNRTGRALVGLCLDRFALYLELTRSNNSSYEPPGRL